MKTARTMKNNIALLRAQRGMTLQNVADHLDTTTAQASRLEKSQRKLTLETLIDLCKIFDVGVEEIVDLPTRSVRNATWDEAYITSLFTWLFQACEDLGFKPKLKDVVSWANYIYHNIPKQNHSSRELRALCYHFAKIGDKSDKNYLPKTKKRK